MSAQRILIGEVLEGEARLTLAELARACSVHAEWVVELVNEGIVDPAGPDATRWRFTGFALRRARAVRRLQRDLGVNLAGAALALDLLDEIERLRARLRVTERSETGEGRTGTARTR
jgi:chaperone modulatory protein CbpM